MPWRTRPACCPEIGLVAFATETVYGLVVLATDPAAVDRIYHVKGRPPCNPLIVHVEGITQARQCTAVWPKAWIALPARSGRVR